MTNKKALDIVLGMARELNIAAEALKKATEQAKVADAKAQAEVNKAFAEAKKEFEKAADTIAEAKKKEGAEPAHRTNKEALDIILGMAREHNINGISTEEIEALAQMEAYYNALLED